LVSAKYMECVVWGLQLHIPTGWDIKGDEWQYSFLWQPFRETLRPASQFLRQFH